MPELWKLDRAAQELGGVSTRTVRRLIKEGALAHVKIRGSIRLRPEDIRAYIDRCAGQAVPDTGDDTCQSASYENETKTESSSGRTRRSGGEPTPEPTAERYGALLAFDAKTIRERKKQRQSGRNGS